ncbi:MAG: NAD-dependent epimerase/dehydratase family protein, partial [Candidatus Omnitrophota bacterium]
GALEAGIKRFVFSSSAKIYGSLEDYPSKEDAIPNPETPYALTKMVGENFCRMFSEKYDMEIICLRYFSVYGPYQNLHYGYVGPIVDALCNGRVPVLPGDETLERDFTYIDDVVSAVFGALITSNIKFGIFNVGAGKASSLKEVIYFVNRFTSKNIEPIYQPLLKGMARKTLADLSQAREVLGYKPSVGLEQGLKELVIWYLSSRVIV